MRLLSAVLLASLLTAPIAVNAQNPHVRKGFTAAVGLGVGSASLTCDGCDSDRETSLGLRLMFGGALRSNLILAGEIEGWSKNLDGGTANLTWISFVTQWYPNDASGFFVKGGVGASGVTLESTGGTGSLKLETVGPGLVAGTGYDLRVSRNFSLTPYATFLLAAKADAEINGQKSGGKLGGNLLHIGVAATWH